MSSSLPTSISRVLVVGAGRSGVAAARALAGTGRDVLLSDSKARSRLDSDLLRSAEEAGVGVFLGEQGEDQVEEIDLLVKSPGVPAEAEIIMAARSRGVPVWSEVELASRLLPNAMVGVTGTNGKTTATALIGHMFRVAGRPVRVLGNIGTPVVSVVGEVRPEEELVLELSSFQLEDVHEFRPAAGVLLNVTQDHLDRHRTMERYAACKGRLFSRQGEGDTAVLNASDPYAAALGRELEEREDGPQVVYFSVAEAASAPARLAGGLLYLQGHPAIRAEDVSLRGLHNMENCLAAATAALARGLPWDAVVEALGTFPGVPHRLESAGFVDGVEYVNDSKATNVEAALKALASFRGGVHLILGGRDKGSDYRPLARACAGLCSGVYALGEAEPLIAEAFAEAVQGGPGASEQRVPAVTRCGNLERAFRVARERAKAGEVVLLSPACASFDQYGSFEERGRHFLRLVEEAGGTRPANEGGAPGP